MNGIPRMNNPKTDQYDMGWVEAEVANSGHGLWVPSGSLAKAEPLSRREARQQKRMIQNFASNQGKFFSTTTNTTGNPGRGLDKSPGTISFSALRAMSYSSQIDMLIIGALQAAARRFGQIVDVPGKQKGFRVVHRQYQDPQFDSDTPDIRRRCAEVEEILKHPTSPPHATFMEFLMAAIEEELVLDRRCVVLSQDRAGRVGSYHLIDGTCYSADTEVLTRDGWKLFTQVNLESDEFATRNQETKEFEWQKATYFHKQAWDGEVVHVSSRSLDLLVTPNHRMLVTNSHEPNYEKIVKAEALVGIHSGNLQLPATSVWNGESVQRFRLERTNVRGRDLDIDGDDYSAFMGMWLSEGSKGGRGKNSSTIVVSQKSDSKGFVEFRALLTRILGREPFYNGKVFSFKSSALYRYLAQFGGATEKYIPGIVKNMTKEQLAIFWRYYMLGDGCYEKGESKVRVGANALGFTGRQRIVTSSVRMAGDLQEVAQKLGYSASVTPRASRDTVMSDGRVILAENSSPSWAVSLRTSTYQSFTASTTHYVGDVYCVSVPNEILYVRRRGLPVWCGNTVKPVIEVLGPWMQENAIVNEDAARYNMQIDLWKNPPANPRTGAPVNVDLSNAAYVQVLDGRPVAAWAADEMHVSISNPTVAMDHAFYGRSPLERSIYLSILFGKALRFNSNLFDVTFPEGILAITGDYDEEGIEAFKRAALDFDPSEASTRLPVITGEAGVQAQLIQLRESPQDMKMVEMMRMIANFKCAAYRVHPSVINVTDEGQPILGDSDDSAIEQSIGDGFHGLMVDQANMLTNAIVAKRYDDLIVIVEGLDVESEEKLFARMQAEAPLKTINERRVGYNLKELPDKMPENIGDYVADSAYLQIIQMKQAQAQQDQAAQQQQQQQDMGSYEQGDFGQGADEQGQPWGADASQSGDDPSQQQPQQSPQQKGGFVGANSEDAGRDDAQQSGVEAGNPQAKQQQPVRKAFNDADDDTLHIRISGSLRSLSELLPDEDEERVY
jgi:hypothetical protein